MSGLGSRFISERDVEARKKVQEAEGVIEEPFDGRSLYERLQASFPKTLRPSADSLIFVIPQM